MKDRYYDITDDSITLVRTGCSFDCPYHASMKVRCVSAQSLHFFHSIEELQSDLIQ